MNLSKSALTFGHFDPTKTQKTESLLKESSIFGKNVPKEENCSKVQIVCWLIWIICLANAQSKKKMRTEKW